ncbi:hypothetical protein PspLS_05335, partial [Pyricularia sp. CBS 133598]
SLCFGSSDRRCTTIHRKGVSTVWRGFLVVQDAALALKRSQRTGDLKADEGQTQRAGGLHCI